MVASNGEDPGSKAGTLCRGAAAAFVIDADGNVARTMYGVKPEGHADEVLEVYPARPGSPSLPRR